jgi:hypothetical protein
MKMQLLKKAGGFDKCVCLQYVRLDIDFFGLRIASSLEATLPAFRKRKTFLPRWLLVQPGWKVLIWYVVVFLYGIVSISWL